MKVKLFLLTWILTLIVFSGFMLVHSVEAQGGAAGFANVRISNFLRMQPRTAITVTMNGTLNSTGSYQRITSAGTVATSGGNITIKPSGSILYIVNSGSNQITFTETGILKSAGNIVLGTLDSATLLSDGTNWYQIGASNN